LFREFLPESAEDVLALEPEELGELILQYFCSLSAVEQDHQMNRYSFGLDHNIAHFGPQHRIRLARALMEAWVWLEHEMFIAPRPGEQGDWYFVTRRGRRLAEQSRTEPRSWSATLPQGKLHPLIAARVSSDFLRGDYDSAILKAFKEVEIAVRIAGKFAHDDVGVGLMRLAFATARGPLTDMSVVEPEREATAHLFAGAIGLFKNPLSHRHLGVSDPDRVLELLGLASYIIYLVDERARKSAP
jgi:uncharacterized protein (TIGR02391 family)